MKSIKSRLDVIRDALLTVSDNVGHYRAMDKTDKYIVWAEDGGGDTLYYDNKMIDQAIQGSIDYFTKSEGDENVDKIFAALIEAGISFRLSSVQYEEETGYKHYEWEFEV